MHRYFSLLMLVGSQTVASDSQVARNHLYSFPPSQSKWRARATKGAKTGADGQSEEVSGGWLGKYRLYNWAVTGQVRKAAAEISSLDSCRSIWKSCSTNCFQLNQALAHQSVSSEKKRGRSFNRKLLPACKSGWMQQWRQLYSNIPSSKRTAVKAFFFRLWQEFN